MVKFGGVRNYIVATWDPADLEACADLNLPCADVTAFLPEPMDNTPNAGVYGTHDYFVSRLSVSEAWRHCKSLVLLRKLAWLPASGCPVLCPQV